MTIIVTLSPEFTVPDDFDAPLQVLKNGLAITTVDTAIQAYSVSLL